MFLLADDIKISHTVNLQLAVHFHNPTLIPFAVGVLQLNTDKTKFVKFTKKINTINRIHNLCNNSYRLHQRSRRSFRKSFIFGHSKLDSYMWEPKETFFLPDTSTIVQMRDANRVSMYFLFAVPTW
jgi:hypothetical protein